MSPLGVFTERYEATTLQYTQVNSTSWHWSSSETYRLSDCRLSAKLVPNDARNNVVVSGLRNGNNIHKRMTKKMNL
jgi:hypothetical protein